MRSVKLVLAGIAMVSAQPASADVVTDWWDVALRYFNAGQGAPGPRTPDMERASTRTALAMFEAVNAIDRRYHSYLNVPAADSSASQDAAAATAAFKVLLHHYPANKGPLEEGYTLSMAGIPDTPAKQSGVRIGEQAALAAIAAGGLDPAIAQVPYRPRAVPGSGWRPPCRRSILTGRP